MYKLCRHIMPDGARCEAPALKGMPYCYHHDRLHRTTSRQAHRKKTIELPPLENRTSVLMALSDVLGALAAGRIDSNRAGRLIYGFQVAAQFAPSGRTAAFNPVKSLTRTRSGDDLAPELWVCTQDDDCASCPTLESCRYDRSRAARAALAAENESTDDEDDQDNEDDEDDEDDEEDEADGADDGKDIA